MATYVFRDDRILRPYFANVHAPGGIQVTRHHPPVPNVDATDHDTMHPGVWLAFGDLSGSKVVVKPGESFRLRCGALLHAGPKDAAPDLNAAYADFVSQLSPGSEGNAP